MILPLSGIERVRVVVSDRPVGASEEARPGGDDGSRNDDVDTHEGISWGSFLQEKRLGLYGSDGEIEREAA